MPEGANLCARHRPAVLRAAQARGAARYVSTPSRRATEGEYTMNADYILDLADKVARTTLGGKPGYTTEDWQDATQEAALKIWLVRQGAPHAGEGYLFNAARSAVYDWLRGWLRHPRGGTILDYLDYPAEDGAAGSRIDERQIDALAPMLAQARRKAYGWTERHIQQEIALLKLLLRGVSIDGIGMELGLSRRNVYAIRERLLPRLKRIAQERQS